jgi:hypothetical protein
MGINPHFVELTKLIAVLYAVVVGYILTGIANNCLVNGEPFDIKVLIKGIVKTITACVSLIIVAYVCTIIDLSSLGFEPQTAITSGIIVYTAKLIRNAMGLLGLTKAGKENKEDVLTSSPILYNKAEEELQKEDNDFTEVNIDDNDEGPKAVG